MVFPLVSCCSCVHNPSSSLKAAQLLISTHTSSEWNYIYMQLK